MSETTETINDKNPIPQKEEEEEIVDMDELIETEDIEEVNSTEGSD